MQWLDEHSSVPMCGIKLAREVNKFVSETNKYNFLSACSYFQLLLRIYDLLNYLLLKMNLDFL